MLSFTSVSRKGMSLKFCSMVLLYEFLLNSCMRACFLIFLLIHKGIISLLVSFVWFYFVTVNVWFFSFFRCSFLLFHFLTDLNIHTYPFSETKLRGLVIFPVDTHTAKF